MDFSRRSTLFLIYFFLAFIAIVITFSHTPFGAAISMDSLSYINAARKLFLGQGISLPDYGLDHGDLAPLTFWPPIYPIFLVVGIPGSHLFNVDIARSISWLNALCLFCTLLLFWNIVKTVSQNILAICSTLLLTLLPGIQVIYLYAWSETLFIPLLLLAFLFQIKFFETPLTNRNRWLWGSTAVLALAFQVRYAGIGVFIGFLASILTLSSSSVTDRFVLMAKSTGLFLILIMPLMLRNHLVANNLFGLRDPSAALLSEDITTLGHLLGLELLPFPLMIFLPVLLGFMAIVFVVFRPDVKNAVDNHHGKLIFLTGLLWSVAYLAFVVLSRQRYHSDLDTRMIGPAIPLLMLSGIALLNCLRNMGYSKIVIACFIVWFGGMSVHGYQVHKSILNAWRTTGTPGEIHGITYNSTSNPGFAVFMRLKNIFNPTVDEIILTDLDRPQLMNYFLPTARVKQIPKGLSHDNLGSLKGFMKRSGFAFISSETTAALFEKEFGKTGSFFQVKDPQGNPYPYILMKLPSP